MAQRKDSVKAFGSTNISDDKRQSIFGLSIQFPLDPALVPYSVTRAVESVENWWGLGGLGTNLGVPELQQLDFKRRYSDPAQQKEALIVYWLQNVPNASWSTLAGTLHYMGERRALQKTELYSNTIKGASDDILQSYSNTLRPLRINTRLVPRPPRSMCVT